MADNPYDNFNLAQKAPIAPSPAPPNPTANPYDAFNARQQTGNPLAQFTSPKAPPAAQNPYDAFNAQPKPQEQPQPQAQQQAQPISPNPPPSGQNPYDLFNASQQRLSNNPLLSLSPEERTQSARPDPENNEDEPWYSKTWDWMNKPLWDLHQYGTRTGAGVFERGAESGAEDLISGLTSPLSLAIIVGTFGEGALEKVGMTGASTMFGNAVPAVLRSVGVSAEASPYVARGLKVMMDAGFTGQMLTGLVTQSPQFLDALKDGDYETATRLGVNITAIGGLTALGARTTFEDAAYVKDAVNGTLKTKIDELKLVKKLAGDRDAARVVASERAFTVEKIIAAERETAGAADPAIEGGVVQSMEAGHDRKLIQDQHDALAGTLAVRPGDIEISPLTHPDDFIYHAVDKKIADMVRNSGIKMDKLGDGHASPTEAIDHAALPPSGDKSDLRVFAIPRSELPTQMALSTSDELPQDSLPNGRLMHGVSWSDIRYHELGHAIGANNLGWGAPEVLSHLHPELAGGSAAAATRIQPPNRLMMPNGNVDVMKLSPEELANYVTMHLAGGAAQEVMGGRPMDRNPGMRSDLRRLDDIFQELGYSDEEQFEHVAAAKQRAKDLLSDPVHKAIMEKYGKERETGLDQRFQIGPERMKQMHSELQARKNAADAESTARKIPSGNQGPDTGTKSGGPEKTVPGDKEGPKLSIDTTSPEEQEYLETAKSFGIDYRGIQHGSNDTHAVFQDPASKTSFIINTKDWSPEQFEAKLSAARERMTLSHSASTDKNIMPSHEVHMATDGEHDIIGDARPLRPDRPHDLTMDNARFNALTQDQKERILARYKAGTNLTGDQLDLAKKMEQRYASELERAQNAGKLRMGVENYHPRAYVDAKPKGFFQDLFGKSIDPENNPAYASLRHQSDNGAFDTNIAAAKHRMFETNFQADMAGREIRNPDLAKDFANYQYRLDLAIADQNFLDGLRASGAKGPDGRPLVALEGSSKILGEESKNPAVLVSPKAIRGVPISNEIVKAMMEDGRLEDLVNSGKIDKLPYTREIELTKKGENGEAEKVTVPAYAWSTNGFHTIDHPSFRDWQHIGKDTDGNNVIMKASMRVHPAIADYIRQVVGAATSPIRESKVGAAALATSSEAKHLQLSFSPFHAAQEGLRGVMAALGSIGNSDAMKSWADWKPYNVEKDPLLQMGVRNNLTLGTDYKAQAETSEGLTSNSKLISTIPGLNRLQGFIQSVTFDKIIPGLKARAFKSNYYRFLADSNARGTVLTADEVALKAAKYTNDSFGGQHWRDLGVTTNMQDISRLAALAPDWFTSEVRMLYRAAGGMGAPEASIARSDMLRLSAALYMTARVVNMLSTGKPHPEAPFGLVVKGRDGEDDKVYSMRTLPTDLVHALSDPRGFIAGRVNPLIVRPGLEFISGRNDRGQKVTLPDQVEDLSRNIVPIGAQGLFKGNLPGFSTNADQLTKAAGATVYTYHTEAENLAQRVASDHMPSGPVDPRELRTHQRNIMLEDGLRTGDVSRGDVLRLLPRRQAEELIKNSNMTPLQGRFARLPLSDALDVWSLATPAEKDSLHSLLWKKRLNYIQEHTPAQRDVDPAWKKMQNVYGDLQGNGNSGAPPLPDVTAPPAAPAPSPIVQSMTPTPTLITRLSNAISEAEGALMPGSIPKNANNPGDLKLGDQGLGQLGQGITKFATFAEGRRRLENQVRSMFDGSSDHYSPNMTIAEISEIYTGRDQARAWAARVASSLGVTPNTKIGDIVK